MQKYRLRHSSFFIHTYDKSSNLIWRNSLFKQLNMIYDQNDYGNYGRNCLWMKRTMAEPECGRSASKAFKTTSGFWY